jgi:endonuclease YncB( thermonuclease family)
LDAHQVIDYEKVLRRTRRRWRTRAFFRSLSALRRQAVIRGAALVIAMTAAAFIGWQYRPGAVRVVDGDTIRMGITTYRLVGFDTPEIGDRARCERERTLGERASRRLRELVASADPEFTRVACSCRPGTEGTQSCNYGRLCGHLRVRGRDVGSILISEGLARPYVCGGTSCPPRAGWC